MRPAKAFNANPFAYHEEITLEIATLSNQGVGIGRFGPENWVVFVPFALPGETVRARVWFNEKSYSQADLLEVLVASPNRVVPKCRLFGQCGGCQYQNLSYEVQLQWKTRQVAELLEHQAEIKFPVNPAIASPRQFFYRSKITPHFSRPKKPVPGADSAQAREIPAIGFLKHGRRQEIVDVPECPIAMEEINAALPALRKSVFASAASYKNGATLLLRAAEGRVETNPRVVVTEHIGDLQFHFLAGDFFQNNPFILPSFVEFVASRASVSGLKYLVDAYCGSGLFGLSLARKFEQVTGVEISESGADWARRNAEVNKIENAQFLAASAETIFAQLTYPAEKTAVVIDPPRKGCDEQFLRQLFDFGPARVVYISCNPATQIRDISAFTANGYELIEVQPFDLFPNTKHLECVAVLEKKQALA